MNVLLVIDVQKDFCPGGALATDKGSIIIPKINELMNSDFFDFIYATKDWHAIDDPEFKEWPVHCVQFTEGAMLHDNLDIGPMSLIVYKNTFSGLSGFSNESSNRLIPKSANVYICGIATDYCVKATALDAKKFYTNVSVILDATAEVSSTMAYQAVQDMVEAGISFIHSGGILI